MNPIILFDEADKIAGTPQGKEISNTLIHLLDPQQNESFQDRYFQGIELDLSRAFMILSLNDEASVDPVLANRIEFVHIMAPSIKDKIEIARLHLIPKCAKDLRYDEHDVVFTKSIISFMITKLPAEDGVRGLLRIIKACMLKINLITMLDRLQATSTSPCQEVMTMSSGIQQYAHKITLPFHVTEDFVTYIVTESTERRNISSAPVGMYI